MEREMVDRAIEHFLENGATLVVMRTTMGLSDIERFWKGALIERGIMADIEENIWSGISPSGMMILSTDRGKFIVSWFMDDVDEIIKIDIPKEEDIDDAYNGLMTISSDSFKKFTDK